MKRSVFLVVVFLFACAKAEKAPPPAAAAPPGDPAQGKMAMSQYGCGSCHVIPAVENARGRLGPPLAGFGSKDKINGRVDNNEENLVAFLEDPRKVDRHSGMQSIGVKPQDARNIAAYLLTLK